MRSDVRFSSEIVAIKVTALKAKPVSPLSAWQADKLLPPLCGREWGCVRFRKAAASEHSTGVSQKVLASLGVRI